MKDGTISPEDAVLSVPEVSRELGKGRYTVVRLIALGRLEGRSGPGRTLIVTRRSVDAFKRQAEALHEEPCTTTAA